MACLETKENFSYCWSVRFLLEKAEIRWVDQKSNGCFSSHFDWRRGSQCRWFHDVSFHWMIKKLGEVGHLICTHSGKLYILWSKWIASSLFRPFKVKWKSKVFPYAQNAMLIWLWRTSNIYLIYFSKFYWRNAIKIIHLSAKLIKRV